MLSPAVNVLASSRAGSLPQGFCVRRRSNVGVSLLAMASAQPTLTLSVTIHHSAWLMPRMRFFYLEKNRNLVPLDSPHSLRDVASIFEVSNTCITGND